MCELTGTQPQPSALERALWNILCSKHCTPLRIRHFYLFVKTAHEKEQQHPPGNAVDLPVNAGDSEHLLRSPSLVNVNVPNSQYTHNQLFVY